MRSGQESWEALRQKWKEEKNFAALWMTSDMIWACNVKQLAVQKEMWRQQDGHKYRSCRLLPQQPLEWTALKEIKEERKKFTSQCKWLTEVWTKLLAGRLGLVRKGRSVVGCARPRTRWVTGAQSPSPSSKLELRPSSGPKEGKCAELKILLNGFYPPLIEESLSMGCNVRGKSCLWILIALHGTSSQDAIIHIAMPGPGISQQVFVFKPLGSVLQTSTQEKASESCIGAFL